MKKLKGSEIVSSIVLILIGLLFMIYKSQVISIAMTFIGVTLIVLGVIDAVKGNAGIGILKMIFGLLVLATGWLIINLALYILGAVLMAIGFMRIYALSKLKIKKITLPVVLHIAQPVIYLLAGICLFFNQSGALSWVFTVSGLFMVINGVVGLLGELTDN